ncbi:MAG: nitrous oxide-stimulated promoter family protein [Promethearchaeota archaeon]
MTTRENRPTDPKIRKEKETVERMIRYYCDSKHDSLTGSLCESCTELLDYSHHRLDHCTYGEDKPTCRKCEIHCYRPTMREEIRKVMRYSGPRLVVRAPADWIRHWVHERL